MTTPVAAIFCMPERGHLHRLLPLITGLAGRGVDAVVFTDAAYRVPVERAGGRLVDLFARYPLDAADAESRPIPSRYVTFAAHYAVPLIEEVARLQPSVIVYDTFAVVGYLLGRALGVPYVNMCVGHRMTPARARETLERDPRVATSEACRRAVDTLRDHWGIADASPFLYFTAVSPFLNVYCEPPEFLLPEDRAAFAPIAFMGSLPSPDTIGASWARSASPNGQRGSALSIYASFGTVMWRYYADVALQALGALSDVVGGLPHAHALISLGGYALPEESRNRLERPNVHVADYVDQWKVLQEDASVFVTHHGLNSTHEAIYHAVPMISYPFSPNQQGLAARCQELGLAIPLVDAPRAPVSAGAVRAALAGLESEAARLAAGLGRARAWEIAVMNGRAEVIQRILDLAVEPPTGHRS